MDEEMLREACLYDPGLGMHHFLVTIQKKKKKMTAAKRFVPNVAKQLYKLENLKPTKLEESREKGGNNNF